MDSIYLYDKYGEPISYDLWRNVTRFIDWVCDNWQQPDEGIWEVRGGRQEFLYSRVMCWVAIDRAVRLARQALPSRRRSRAGTPCATRSTRHLRALLAPETEGVRAVQGLRMRSMPPRSLMPLLRFISPTDPRWLSTLRAIEHDLVSDSLVYRYHTGDEFPDGLVGEEGTFSLCSFWYAECLSRAGDLQQARFIFEKMLGYANHVGLYRGGARPSRASTSATSRRRSRTSR